MTELIYELCDAHADTMQRAEPLRYDPEWSAHLDYLRDLQRVARGLIAHPIRTDTTKTRTT